MLNLQFTLTKHGKKRGIAKLLKLVREAGGSLATGKSRRGGQLRSRVGPPLSEPMVGYARYPSSDASRLASSTHGHCKGLDANSPERR
jgi:hypothetical protein